MLSCFFFNDTATTEIYTLSLHDALPIFISALHLDTFQRHADKVAMANPAQLVNTIHSLFLAYEDKFIVTPDRKSTRLNSSHANISYAVFCLKKKKTQRFRNQKVAEAWVS